jgi:hypothetical protein
VRRCLLSIFVLLALTAASPSALHDHGGHDAGVYDDQCPARVASLYGSGLPTGVVPPAPRPLPAPDRPAAPASAGHGATSARSLQPRAPPLSSAAV